MANKRWITICLVSQTQTIPSDISDEHHLLFCPRPMQTCVSASCVNPYTQMATPCTVWCTNRYPSYHYSWQTCSLVSVSICTSASCGFQTERVWLHKDAGRCPRHAPSPVLTGEEVWWQSVCFYFKAFLFAIPTWSQYLEQGRQDGVLKDLDHRNVLQSKSNINILYESS